MSVCSFQSFIIDYYVTMKTWKDICNVLASLNSPKKVDDFLYDLTSEKEREEFARRFEVAQLLDQ